MKKNGLLLVFTLVLLSGLSSCKNQSSEEKGSEKDTQTTADKQSQSQRIVSLNGAVTEVVSELGKGNEIVGVDVTSTHPEKVTDNAKDLGHVRSLNVEEVMALRPDIILGTEEELSPDLRKKMKAAKAGTHFFTRDFSQAGTRQFIDEVAEVLKISETGALKTKIDEQLSEVEKIQHPPKVLFIYARGPGTMMVAGNNTPMKKIVELAGGQYSIDSFDSFKPLTPEALMKQNPDVLLLFDSGLKSLGGKKGLMDVKGVGETTAGKNGNVITMNGGLLTSFGPRLGKAAKELNKKLKHFAE